MRLSSPDFEHKGKIPSKFTCDGKNINPRLEISDVPPFASSLTLIMDDPDVPEHIRKDRLYVHWIVFDMPADLEVIAEDSLPPGTIGNTSAGRASYIGPCPPDREHRYFFKLYALDKFLNLEPGASKDEVEQAMKGHILDHTELMGRYERVGG